MASNRKSGNLQDITKFKEYITVSARWVQKLRVKDIMASGRIVWKVTGKMGVGRNMASGRKIWHVAGIDKCSGNYGTQQE